MSDNHQKASLIGNRGFRIFVILTIIAFIFSFNACGKKEKNTHQRGAVKLMGNQQIIQIRPQKPIRH